MKVIICGGGQVGYNLARYLDTQRNDVTLIDLRPELVEKAVKRYCDENLPRMIQE